MDENLYPTHEWIQHKTGSNWDLKLFKECFALCSSHLIKKPFLINIETTERCCDRWYSRNRRRTQSWWPSSKISNKSMWFYLHHQDERSRVRAAKSSKHAIFIQSFFQPNGLGVDRKLSCLNQYLCICVFMRRISIISIICFGLSVSLRGSIFFTVYYITWTWLFIQI